MKKLFMVLLLLFTTTAQAFDDNDFKKMVLDTYATFEEARIAGRPSLAVELVCWMQLKPKDMDTAAVCATRAYIGHIFELNMSAKFRTPLSTDYNVNELVDRIDYELKEHGYSQQEIMFLNDFLRKNGRLIMEVLADKR
jgi:hypothetical protein